jgi:prevent-host-death family protein
MVTNLREAKSQLSKLVQMASDGEEIVITVRGQPAARLTSIGQTDKKIPNHAEWASELEETAASVCVDEPQNTPQEYWDDLREDRH